jgi:hypothetical protein
MKKTSWTQRIPDHCHCVGCRSLCKPSSAITMSQRVNRNFGQLHFTAEECSYILSRGVTMKYAEWLQKVWNSLLTNIILTPCRCWWQCCHPTAGCSWYCCWSCRHCGIRGVVCCYDCSNNRCGCVSNGNILSCL